jgi:hypothetical protein
MFILLYQTSGEINLPLRMAKKGGVWAKMHADQGGMSNYAL